MEERGSKQSLCDDFRDFREDFIDFREGGWVTAMKRERPLTTG